MSNSDPRRSCPGLLRAEADDADSAEVVPGQPVGGRTIAQTQALTAAERHLPAVGSGVDRVIRASTAVVVLAVAGIAAYISYWHAYDVVRAFGESGTTARLEPATIDGLVYASSMVILYAARHRRPVPALARWLLALGIVATLAANMAQGWTHGPVGAVIAAWPAVSLVGSYELLVWIIRTAAAGDGGRVPDVALCEPEDNPGARMGRPAAPAPDAGPVSIHRRINGFVPNGLDGPLHPARVPGPGQTSGPYWNAANRADQLADQSFGCPGPVSGISTDSDINAAAVAAYRASVQAGEPLSERKLARMFGKTSRRWARNRMAEARQN
jgi:Protein of unknown function (DUF2637)